MMRCLAFAGTPARQTVSNVRTRRRHVASDRAEATQAQGRKIQREIDALEAGAPNDSKKEPKAMQACAREYPTEFASQHHAKPATRADVRGSRLQVEAQGQGRPRDRGR